MSSKKPHISHPAHIAQDKIYAHQYRQAQMRAQSQSRDFYAEGKAWDIAVADTVAAPAVAAADDYKKLVRNADNTHCLHLADTCIADNTSAKHHLGS